MSSARGTWDGPALDELGSADGGLVEARLQLALEATGLGLWDWDVGTGALIWDHASRRMLGVLPEQATGWITDIEQPIHPEDLPGVQAALEAAIAAAGDIDVRYRAVWPDGSEHWIHARGRAVVDAGGVVRRLIGTNRDITESHRTNAQQVGDAARLASLVSVAQALGAAQSEAAVLEVVTGRGVGLLGAAGAVLTLPQPATGTVRVLATSFFDEQLRTESAELPLDLPLPMIDAIVTGTAWYLPDRAAALAAFPGAGTMYERANTEASAAVPLRSEGRVLGSLSVAFDHDHLWRTADRELLEAFAALTAQALDRIQAREAERSATRASERLSVTLQRSLLTNPPEPNDLQVTARYQPAAQEAQIGGDWYDAFLTSDDDVLTLVIGDVAGHDGPAAAAMAQVRNVLRGVAQTLGSPPAAVMTALDTALAGLRFGALTTAIIGQVGPPDPAGGQRLLTWSNAGHPPPLLITPHGRAELLWRPADRLLGVTLTATRTDHTTVLEPGSTLVLYTDGLVERRGETLDDGLDRLVTAAGELHHLPPERLCDALLERLGADAEDDIALLVLRPPPTPGGPAATERAGDASDSSLPPMWTERPLPASLGGVTHTWELASLAQLASLRAELRDRLDAAPGAPSADSAAAERLLLTVDELASNALRHGQGPVRARIAFEAAGWLVDISDATTTRAPREARDRDLGEGGMGLYLIAAFAGQYGWQVDGGRKSVWAVVHHDHHLPAEPVLPPQRVARAREDPGPGSAPRVG